MNRPIDDGQPLRRTVDVVQVAPLASLSIGFGLVFALWGFLAGLLLGSL